METVHPYLEQLSRSIDETVDLVVQAGGRRWIEEHLSGVSVR